MMRPSLAVLCAAMLALSAGPAGAGVDDVSPVGFTLSETADIAAPPERVYDALIAPARWWSAEHTYSHDAANLSLDARAGGCWCETLPGGGSVQHLVVVNAMPGKLLRLRGALGPLQAMAVDGALTFMLGSGAGVTHLSVTYTIGGYSRAGYAELSKAVDGVLGLQIARLKRFVETGTPDTPLSDQTNKGTAP